MLGKNPEKKHNELSSLKVKNREQRNRHQHNTDDMVGKQWVKR